jgi:hypothetical protein
VKIVALHTEKYKWYNTRDNVDKTAHDDQIDTWMYTVLDILRPRYIAKYNFQFLGTKNINIILKKKIHYKEFNV